eukprot:CAMPEP_0198702372 /NCGR_PEP_ID=MMETSP1468-20131203/388727_1 /TAXON_ID=1461545 /ORGANISM="Mantoniella sp, Strain CCMP1436" /LENGTH=129 /DNA_ID=CAMNT_0044460899 /DNA_START=211 /DNA_END=600 /DNA_ORIENTATION=+
MSIVSPLIFAGDAALVDLMERAESEIDEALDAADGFHNLGDHEPAAAATRAVRRARHALGRTAGALLRLLPAPLGLRRATELAERYAKRVAADALALDDISMDEAEALRAILTEAFATATSLLYFILNL